MREGGRAWVQIRSWSSAARRGKLVKDVGGGVEEEVVGWLAADAEAPSCACWDIYYQLVIRRH